MTHLETTLPFIRAAVREDGRTRRSVERRVVRLRCIDALALSKPARSREGVPMLEFEGRRISYLSMREEFATVAALQAGMENRTKCEMRFGGRKRTGRGRKEPEVLSTGDGLAEVERAVADFERDHVVVEGWVARLVRPGDVRVVVMTDGDVALTDGNRLPDRESTRLTLPGQMPWLEFPLVRRADAEALASGLSKALAGSGLAGFASSAVLEPEEPYHWNVEDPEGAGRLAVREEAFLRAESAGCLIGLTRDVLGHLGRDAVAAHLDLRDALAASDEAGMEAALVALGSALAGHDAPGAVKPTAWATLKVAACSLPLRFRPNPARA